MCWTCWMLNPANTLTSKKTKQYAYIKRQPLILNLYRGKATAQGGKLHRKYNLQVLQKKKSIKWKIMIWLPDEASAPAPLLLIIETMLQDSRSQRHIMHNSAMNVWGLIDRENGALMTEMEHFIRKPVRVAAVERLAVRECPHSTPGRMAFCSRYTLN